MVFLEILPSANMSSFPRAGLNFTCIFVYVMHLCVIVITDEPHVVVDVLVNNDDQQNSVVDDDDSCVDIKLGSQICLKVSSTSGLTAVSRVTKKNRPHDNY